MLCSLPECNKNDCPIDSQIAIYRFCLEQDAQVEERQYLDLDGEVDNMEAEFEEEKGRRSLASIFESDEDDVVEVDAGMEDDSLKVAALYVQECSFHRHKCLHSHIVVLTTTNYHPCGMHSPGVESMSGASFSD